VVAVAVAIFQQLDSPGGNVSRGDAGVGEARHLADVNAAVLVERHRERIDDVWLAGGEVDLEARMKKEGSEVLLGCRWWNGGGPRRRVWFGGEAPRAHKGSDGQSAERTHSIHTRTFTGGGLSQAGFASVISGERLGNHRAVFHASRKRLGRRCPSPDHSRRER